MIASCIGPRPHTQATELIQYATGNYGDVKPNFFEFLESQALYILYKKHIETEPHPEVAELLLAELLLEKPSKQATNYSNAAKQTIVVMNSRSGKSE